MSFSLTAARLPLPRQEERHIMVLSQMDAGKALTAAAANGSTSEVQRILMECRVPADTLNEFGRTALQVGTRTQRRFSVRGQRLDQCRLRVCSNNIRSVGRESSLLPTRHGCFGLASVMNALRVRCCSLCF